MKRFSGYLIVGSETRAIEIIAETMSPDSTCATRFHQMVTKPDPLYGTRKDFEIVVQYPTDRLVIDNIEDID